MATKSVAISRRRRPTGCRLLEIATGLVASPVDGDQLVAISRRRRPTGCRLLEMATDLVASPGDGNQLVAVSSGDGDQIGCRLQWRWRPNRSPSPGDGDRNHGRRRQPAPSGRTRPAPATSPAPVFYFVAGALFNLLSQTLSRPQQLTPHGHIIESAIEAAASAVVNLRDYLNELDSKVGDGDCGSNMYRGAMAILEDMKKYYPLNDPAETVNEIGSSVKRVMGGTSGIIYSILCKAAFAELKAKRQTRSCTVHWFAAREAGIAAVSKYGGASAGYRTLLDALILAASTLKERLNGGDNSIEAFIAFADAAVAGAESTKDMQAQAGRSTYIPADILASVPDPGAMAATAWYRATILAIVEKV
ncbi:putative 3,4-dihydroxy-2-butanone kinase [Ipomoea triloba]|uniref:putative 3,4-dihydroxy-2-butanone kinase n=1 Tax=Ipomoea triloba TaxID=35885 RepID=UPI00125D5869|nr:putative 3,4-dihydroxy-2-butanone kinase [Ipomoea triloba]